MIDDMPSVVRYPAEHKDESRRRILGEAARLFRERGYDGVGIDDIMAAADLTRGGFYGHFPSKAALFAEVIGCQPFFVEALRARTGKTGKALNEEAVRLARAYLDPKHRETIARLCSLATLSPEVARAGSEARDAYQQGLLAIATELGRGLGDAEDPDPRALAALALCVGGLTLSRAVADGALADRLSTACGDAIAALFDERPVTRRRRAAHRRPRRSTKR